MGKSLEEACNAQRAASRRHRNQGSQHSQGSAAASANIVTAAAIPTNSTESMTINGRTWIPVPDISDIASDGLPTVNLVEVSDDDIARAMQQNDLFEFEAYLC